MALLGEGDEGHQGTCVRRAGAEEWWAVIGVAGTVYRIHVVRYAQRGYGWFRASTPARIRGKLLLKPRRLSAYALRL